MLKKTVLPLVLFAVIAAPVKSEGQELLSLSDAVDRALEQNYGIRIVLQNEAVAETNDSWGAAGRFPSISIGVTTSGRTDYNDTGDVSTMSLSPGLSLNWVLFNGYSVRVNKEKLETLVSLSRGSTAVLVEQTVQSVVQTYYRALLEREKLRVLEEVMNLSSDRYDYMQSKKEIGSAVTYDILQAKNAWLEDKAANMLQEVTYTNALRDLNFLMGADGGTTYTLTDEFGAQLNDYDWEGLNGKMLSSNKTLRNQYINMALLEKEIALAKSLYYPSLTLRSGVDASNSRIKSGGANAISRDSQDVYTSLSLNFPLFDGGARKRAMAIARIREETGKIETEEMKHSLTNQLGKLFDLYEVRKDLFNVTEENLAAARLNMQISEDKFKAGTINSFNYRDVQLIYLNASLNRLNAIFNLIDTDTALLRLTGGIITEK